MPGYSNVAFNSLSTACVPYTLACLVGKIIYYLQIGIMLIISLAVVFFIWNVFRYFFRADADKKEAGMYVLYSVIGFFVILSFWGLVAILSNTLNLPNAQPMWPFGIGGRGVNTSNSFNGGYVPPSSTNFGTGAPPSSINYGSNIDASINSQSDIPYNPDGDPSIYYSTDIPAEN